MTRGEECPGGAGYDGDKHDGRGYEASGYDGDDGRGNDAALRGDAASADAVGPAEEQVARELAAVFDAALKGEPPSRVTAESVLAAARSRGDGRGARAVGRWARAFAPGGPGLKWAGGLTAVAALVAAIVVVAPLLPTDGSSASSAVVAGGSASPDRGEAAGAAAAPSMAVGAQADSAASAGSDSTDARGAASDAKAESLASAAAPEPAAGGPAGAAEQQPAESRVNLPAAPAVPPAPATGSAATGPAATAGANPPATTAGGPTPAGPLVAGPSSAPGVPSAHAPVSSPASAPATDAGEPALGTGGATTVSPNSDANCAARQLPPLTEREIAAIGGRVPRATVLRQAVASTCLPHPLRGGAVILTEPDGTSLALTVGVFDFSSGAPALPSSTAAATTAGPGNVVVVMPDPTRSRPLTAAQRQDMQAIAGAVAAVG